MKYMIETTEDGCRETIVMNNGNTYTKRHRKTLSGEVVMKVKRILSNTPDVNGVNLLYAGAYPGKREVW